MKVFVAALLLVAVSLAGCSGDDDGPSGSPTPTATGTSSPTATGSPSPSPGPQGPAEVALLRAFDLNDCDGGTFLQPVPLEDVQELLPDGYTAAAVGSVPSLEGILAVDLMACGSFSNPSTEIQDVFFGQAYTFIEAPTDLFPDRDVSADLHFYTFQMIAGEDVLAQVWPIAGYPTHNGTTSVTLTDALLAGVLNVQAGEYSLTATGPAASLSDVDGSFARFTVMAGGDTLIWNGTQALPITHNGAGTLTVPDDSPFAGQGASPTGSLEGEGRIVQGGAFTEQTLVRVFTGKPGGQPGPANPDSV